MGATVLVGRELYRYGYMTNDGPNSSIREAGAIPLNVAEMLMIVGIAGIMTGYLFGPFMRNRKLVKRFTMSKIDRKTEEVIKKIKEGRPIN